METENIPNAAPSDWQPITNKHDLAVLGKLGEEACELGSSLFRCVIQGMDEKEPITNRVNRKWVAQEVADVLAMAEVAIRRLGLNADDIEKRKLRKIAFKEPWFYDLRRQGLDSEWTEWNGGSCPLLDDQMVEVKCKAIGIMTERACNVRWDHRGEWGDIIAYRLA